MTASHPSRFGEAGFSISYRRGTIAGEATSGAGRMADPFTIRIFVPDGEPDGVRLIDRMNWTGVGIAFGVTMPGQ